MTFILCITFLFSFQFVQCVFGHGQHGHGADCGQ